MSVEVQVQKNQIQVTGCPQNFQVMEEFPDMGSPIGYGSTLAKAIEDFISIWELKNNESIESLNLKERA